MLETKLDYTDRFLTKDQKNYIAEKLGEVSDSLDGISLEGESRLSDIESISRDGFWAWRLDFNI